MFGSEIVHNHKNYLKISPEDSDAAPSASVSCKGRCEGENGGKGWFIEVLASYTW